MTYLLDIGLKRRFVTFSFHFEECFWQWGVLLAVMGALVCSEGARAPLKPPNSSYFLWPLSTNIQHTLNTFLSKSTKPLHLSQLDTTLPAPPPALRPSRSKDRPPLAANRRLWLRRKQSYSRYKGGPAGGGRTSGHGPAHRGCPHRRLKETER